MMMITPEIILLKRSWNQGGMRKVRVLRRSFLKNRRMAIPKKKTKFQTTRVL